jgi:hypothetical protein
MTLRLDAAGSADPDEVWRRYTRPSLWPSWAPQIRRVSGVGDPIRPGDTGWVHGPFPLRVPFEILTVDEALREWSWQVGIGPASVVIAHGVDAAGSQSQAWALIHAPAPLVVPYAPLTQLALRRLVEVRSQSA